MSSFKYTSTSFVVKANGDQYCIIYERGFKERILFRSQTTNIRSDVVSEMWQFLNKNQHLINQIVSA